MSENMNDVVEEIVSDAEVMTVPIDDTLSISGEAADAKAVGDALALKADLSAVVNISVDGQAADNQGVILLYGENIPMDENDTTTVKAAIGAAEARTGEDIPISSAAGAQSIASVIASSVDKTADNIAMSASDASTVAERITAVEAAAAAAVKSVNSFTPDDTGNVELTMVPYADNLLSSGSQNSSGAFLIRATGGDASISDGDARISSILGNMTHTGYTPESITPTVSGDFDVEIDRDAFVAEAETGGTYAFSYTTEWSPDIAEWGITVDGTPVDGDSISVEYVAEVRGTITPANPQSFISTGWNLYSQALGYARVVNYSQAYGFRVGGTYTAISFSETTTGAQTLLTVTDRNFRLPEGAEDGYIFVTGADATTEIYMTWSDWTAQANGGTHEAYTQETINLAGIMSGVFPNGLLAVGEVRDEISFNNRRTYTRVERMAYTEENRAAAEATGRVYEVDENYIYLVKASATETSLAEGMGHFTANGHGIEFYTGSTVPPVTNIVYSNDLKNKLERDVLTISEQSLTEDQQAQVMDNIGVTDAIASLNSKIPGFSIDHKTYSGSTSFTMEGDTSYFLLLSSTDIGNCGLWLIRVGATGTVYAFKVTIGTTATDVTITTGSYSVTIANAHNRSTQAVMMKLY